MSIKTEERQVGEYVLQIKQYGAEEGLVLLAKLEKLFGKPFGMILDALVKKFREDESAGILDLELSLSELMDTLLAKVEPEQIPSLAKEILGTTKIREEGVFREILFKTDFAGKYKQLFQVLKEVLLYQYADFLPDLAAAPGLAAASMTQANRIKAKTLPH